MVTKKVTTTMPVDMWDKAKEIIENPLSGVTNWNQLIGMGILSYRQNPQLIDRINKIEATLEILITKTKELETKCVNQNNNI